MEMVRTEDAQNSEVVSTPMHEVPLSNEDEPQQQEEEEEQAPGSIEKIPSKSSSLKRFFKIGANKKASSNAENTENADNAANDADTEDGEDELTTQIQQEIEKLERQKETYDDLKRSRSRRFSFRFHSNSADNDTPSSSSNVNPPHQSRHSLRSSLSTYFNSVFKRKQSGTASKHALRVAKPKENEFEMEESHSSENIELKMVEANDIEGQTAEVINEIETLTISEPKPEGEAEAEFSSVISS